MVPYPVALDLPHALVEWVTMLIVTREGDRRKRPIGGELSPTQRTINRALAQARAPVERGMARLKSWRIFRRSRVGPNRMTVIAKAVLTLEK
ncbi:transposase family protein [Streptomyces tanashiensis]|uniref:Transposase family protein n=1 Tax=Streptomyces tanashiensis TaxID=67367 RepID=A0ABY6QPV9_9ACTN|nr:transposase family protein [Streptomyces tanashiensis]UZX19730.1 transposase family protein [Streptomyces tanashiensis]